MGSEVSNRNKTSYSGARVAPENHGFHAQAAPLPFCMVFSVWREL